MWGSPGDRHFVHRVGGIEKDIQTGNISYDAANHQAMTQMRRNKVANVISCRSTPEAPTRISAGAQRPPNVQEAPAMPTITAVDWTLASV